MNTLAYIAALIAVAWLVEFLFVDLSEPVLAAALVVVWAWLLPMTWIAVLEDKEIIAGGSFFSDE